MTVHTDPEMTTYDEMSQDAAVLFRALGVYLAKWKAFESESKVSRVDAFRDEDGEIIAVIEWHISPVIGHSVKEVSKRLLTIAEEAPS